MFGRGGNAVDAAIATNAAIAVSGPHLCGMGGDLFALVHVDGEVHSLNASGRAGSGADPAGLRAEGRTEMPFRLDVRSVTVPGCVDGWIALHERFGSLPLATILEPAIRLANDGFPASPLMIGALHQADEEGRSNLSELAEQATNVAAGYGGRAWHRRSQASRRAVDPPSTKGRSAKGSSHSVVDCSAQRILRRCTPTGRPH